MKFIRYDTSRILTSDDVADAVIEYAAALAGAGRADTIRIPAIADDGTMTATKILIGPASEIVIEDAEDDELEVDQEEFVARLRAAAATFDHHRPLHADIRSDLTDTTERPTPSG